jgi:hypothetical protein
LGYFGWSHKWWLSVICILYASILEVLVAKLHVAEWARKDLATTELCVQQKVCSFGPFNILSLVSPGLARAFDGRDGSFFRAP